MSFEIFKLLKNMAYLYYGGALVIVDYSLRPGQGSLKRWKFLRYRLKGNTDNKSIFLGLRYAKQIFLHTKSSMQR